AHDRGRVGRRARLLAGRRRLLPGSRRRGDRPGRPPDCPSDGWHASDCRALRVALDRVRPAGRFHRDVRNRHACRVRDMTLRTRPFAVLTPVLLLALAGAATIPIVARSRSAAVREVRLVARGMTFYADGGATPNPTLRVKRGEHVRIVLRNED